MKNPASRDCNRILFLLDFLGRGGAQRVVYYILKYIDREKFSPHLSLFTMEGDYTDSLPGDVFYHNLKVRRTRYLPGKLARLFRKIKPDVVFSTLPKTDSALTLAIKLTGYSPVTVLRSSNFLSKHFMVEPFYTNYLSLWSYRRANKVIASTRAMRNDMIKNFRIPGKKIEIITNPVDIEMLEMLSGESPDDESMIDVFSEGCPVIIAMGRLMKQKGFSYLVRAFKKVREEMNAKLVIMGRGEMEEPLKSLVSELGISEDVLFPGFQSNPYKYLAKADLFVLSSLWEGFPNSLVEAMVCGTPVVSTDCPSGPGEILTSGINGVLVPPADADSLASAILSVLGDKDFALRISREARVRVNDFEVGRIVKRYEEVFQSVISE